MGVGYIGTEENMACKLLSGFDNNYWAKLIFANTQEDTFRRYGEDVPDILIVYFKSRLSSLVSPGDPRLVAFRTRRAKRLLSPRRHILLRKLGGMPSNVSRSVKLASNPEGRKI
ncbi:hypothetical protein H112_05087 [Trichophyton rubrum D6]|uniref:Uncharacterized protein n=2 Tax=Trichophyton TaxID=5550 RepID=A0A022W0R7_TRIRU|nr:hypothetical protein H100_05111 [Trichophyton rubrum MR850]EZF41087.1 hypothetical protein H102_05096 [Trichophyton rubrum CBS 100081]EZF51593.1 hypothetical protein H103_05098 [Trichophyton rubrum CBS 288.86]EZF72838.1 hypothetical protein H105_05118 [Trichophyton soudanense CBS 452.61]EZF83553.1 hypothetical protein H110_05097 [Trichophyton rubrum MR1448]EZF94203.1 hypothetical protein H113_05138 [Trichophyton rubrum MR1459]EZG15895.1 hypothetical protein H107_05228 [Trichophyton rubrum 